MKLPGIYVEIKGDYTELEKNLKAAKALVTSQATQISNSINNALSPTAASNSINSLVKNLGSLNRASLVSSNSFSGIGANLGKFASITGVSEKSLSTLQSRLLRTQAAKTQENALRNIGKACNLSEREIKKLGRQFGLSSAEISKVTGSTKAASQSLLSFGNVAKGALAYFTLNSATASIGNLIRIADTYTLLEGRLRLVTKSEEELKQTEQALFEMAQETRGSYEDLVNVYTRFARATKDTKITQSELLDIVKGVNQALIVSGSTQQESSAAMIQLSQGLASGVLRGEELNSVLEQTPRVAQMIADGLGVTIGKLREYGKEGQLSTDVVLAALLSQAKGVNTEFATMETTVGQAATVLRNTFNDIINDGNDAVGTTKSISESIIDLSNTVHKNKPEIIDLFTGVVTAAGWATERVSVFTNSIKGWAAVAAGALDFTDFATMNPGEFKQWMTDFDNGTAGIKKKLKDTREELAGLSDATPGVAPKMAMLNKQVRDLEAQLKAAEEAQKKLGASAQTTAPQLDKATTATIKLGAAKKKASSASKLHREELRQTVAEARNLVGVYKESTAVLLEWSRAANGSLSDMRSLTFDYGTAGQGDVARLLADRNREFADGMDVINRYNSALSESGQIVSKAQEEFARAKQDFSSMEKELAANPLLSIAEQQNRLAPFADALKEKAEATRKAMAEQLKLNELNASGALTEDALKNAIFGTARAFDELREAQIRDLEASQLFSDNMTAGLMRISDEARITGRDISDYMVGAVDQLNDAMVDFMVDGTSFNDVLNSLSRDMLSMTTKSLITGPLVGSIGGMFGFDGLGAQSANSVNITSPMMVSINGSGTGGLFDSLLPDSAAMGESWFGGFFATGNNQGTTWWDGFYNMGDSVLSALSSLFGGNSGGGSGGGWLSTVGSAVASYYSGSGYHSGGVVGYDSPTFTREVPVSTFIGAPKFHNGLLPDEFPAILQRGESVFTENQTMALGSALASRGNSKRVEQLLEKLINVSEKGGSTRIVNAFDNETVANAMSGGSGQKVILNHVRTNPSAFKAALGIA